MSNTLVIQSHRSPLPYAWLSHCLDSVRHWCELNQFDYRFLGDEMFDHLPGDVQQKLVHQKVIASDLARLHVLKEGLSRGYETVVWLDADFLVFDPARFVLPNEACAVGREVWVQQDEHGKLKVYRKVHNALLMFRRENHFLEFYLDTAERLVRQNQGGMPPQFIGPKLLTALHNIISLPVMESAGMLSPLVIEDIINKGGEALQRFAKCSPSGIAGANLCISSRDQQIITCVQMEEVIHILLNGGFEGFWSI